MTHYTLVAQLYTDASLSRVALSALPDAPVQPHVERRAPLRRLAPALRARFSSSARPLRPAECAPAS
jgi:hypothetical protein